MLTFSQHISKSYLQILCQYVEDSSTYWSGTIRPLTALEAVAKLPSQIEFSDRWLHTDVAPYLFPLRRHRRSSRGNRYGVPNKKIYVRLLTTAHASAGLRRRHLEQLPGVNNGSSSRDSPSCDHRPTTRRAPTEMRLHALQLGDGEAGSAGLRVRRTASAARGCSARLCHCFRTGSGCARCRWRRRGKGSRDRSCRPGARRPPGRSRSYS